MMFSHEADGTWLYTEQQLTARLAALGAVRVPARLALIEDTP